MGLMVKGKGKQPRNREKRPAGGRFHSANYATIVLRIPSPLKQQVVELIDQFHKENAEYLSLPVTGDWWQVLGVQPGASIDESLEAEKLTDKKQTEQL